MEVSAAHIREAYHTTFSRRFERRRHSQIAEPLAALVLLELCKIQEAIPTTTPSKLCSPRIEGSQMEKKQWRVGDLQTMQGADPRAMTMIGFVLYDETGQPCVTFGYGTHDEARSARGYVMGPPSSG